MLLNALLQKITQQQPVDFAETLCVIQAHYQYRPCRFSNGQGGQTLVNPAGTNEGSCKIFAFAKIHGLNEQQTLALFGDYYRLDVLGDPTGTSHPNIRNFIKFGWAGISFETEALLPLAECAPNASR